MPADSLLILAPLFLLVGALYASVGHAGASGYLAAMALAGVEAATMRPTALMINVLVASIAFVQFARAGHFSWRLFWPLAATSVPAAFLGGRLQVSSQTLQLVIGLVLVLSAARMGWLAWRPSAAPTKQRLPSLPLAMGTGLTLGFLAGVSGTGGGIFLSPLILMLGWADPRRTAAVAAPFILVNSIAGLAGLASAGWQPTAPLLVLAICAAAGGIVGATLGSRRATPRALNGLLAVVLVLAGGKLVLLSFGS